MNTAATFESRSFKLVDAPRAPRPTTRASLDLTASDGTGLVLVSLSARVVVDDPLAFTELHLVFENPEPRQLEGRFSIGLPSGASVSRFAMRLGTHWQEGEVVERQAARRAYEDFLHRRQDPALLEHEAGNEFSARVFPIEANSQKEILLSYSQELVSAGDAYRLPLVGLPEIRSLDIRALVGREAGAATAASNMGGTAASWQVVEVHKSAWTPDVDFEVRPPPSGRPGLRNESLTVVRVSPELPSAPDEITSLLVLLDTSASRALGHDRQVELVRTLAQGLAAGAGASTPLVIACFDQTVEVVFEGSAGDFQDADARKIHGRLALGASDLCGALRWAAARKGAGPRSERVLLVTDGVATAGDVEAEQITAAAKSLSEAGVKRLDVLAVGGIRADATLRRLVTAGLERDGTVCDGDLGAAEIAGKLTRATRSGIRVEVPDSTWVWPSRLDGVQPGDSALVYAEVAAGKPVRVLLDGQPVTGGELALGAAERPLVERAWVKARMERLEDMRSRPDTDPDVRAGLQKQIVDLSVKFRVLSPYTALLVLETEADYERFHIDRRALSDILTVGLSGVELQRRTSASAPVSPAEERGAPAMKSAAPEGSLDRKPGNDDDDEEEEAEEEEDEGGTLGGSAPAGAAATFHEVTDLLDAGELAEHDEERSMVRGGDASTGGRPDAFIADSPEPAPAPARRMAALRMEAPMAPPPPAPAMRPMAAPAARAAVAAPSPAAESPSLFRRIADAATDMVSRLQSPAAPAAMAPPPAPPAPPPPPPPGYGAPPPAMPAPAPEPVPSLLPWTGIFGEVMELVLAGKGPQALDRALTWRQGSPGDVLALVAIGEAAELAGDLALAARAYGSLVDLFPSRADLRRFAGERLSRLEGKAARELAIDTFRKAVESRPDHPSGHRLLGMALLRAGRFAEAFEAIATGQARSYPDKFPGVPRILAEDLGLAAAAWIRAEPSREKDILSRLARAGAKLEDRPSVRFVLVWETDANDVDFHIHDAAGGHAYYSSKVLPSGGELYADVTQGYGPECFTIRGEPAKRAYPYRLQAHYFRQGPMGFGMGALQIVEHDGLGGFAFHERPYVVMFDRAFVDLGTVDGALPIPTSEG